MKNTFDFDPAPFIPFRDKKVLERVRRIKRKDITKHKNPDLKIRVVRDDMVEHIWAADIFYRIKTAADAGKKCVLITPNPAHTYRRVAYLINKFRVNCKKLYTFNMDEYADQDGNVAPESYPQSFLRSTKNYFWKEIDEKLRPSESHFCGMTTKNIKDYGKMIADMGGGDACYTGPGWTGHCAFIEPDAPEFDAPLKEWLKMGPRIVTLSPFTIAQNSLHGSFGFSGDLGAVPPKAATIGPAEIIGSKYRMEINALTTLGTKSSWQRFTTRLALHGPVTPRVPTSMHQLLKTDFYVSESIAADIEPDWEMGY
jgi:6-phosphogluconolactonase/glucosamine-6-phosphate isomerase/deaminase